MLIRNNPDIDFDRLSDSIRARLKRYAQGEEQRPPEFDLSKRPVRRQAAVVGSLAELLGLEDQELVEQAYLLLLHRPPTPEELAHCLGELRGGEDKAQVLAWISSSAEADRQREPFRQLRGNRLKRRLVRLPLIGGMVATLLTWALAYPYRRYVNAHLNQLYRLTRDHKAAFADGLAQQGTALRETQDAIELDKAREQAQAEQVAQQLTEQRAAFGQQLAEQRATFEQQLAEQRATFEQRLAERDRKMQAMQQETTLLKLRVSQADRPPRAESAAIIPSQFSTDASAEAGQTPESLADEALYIALEAHFRGSPEAIEARLAYYLPLLKEHAAWRQASLAAADIGCGRGEWLQLLRREGIDCLGIDLNAHNVQACQEAGLHIMKADALQWLASQPADSVGLISSFHLIEHLEPERLFLLLRETARVLVPGGLMILETPNPENLVTGATNFYIDPTHRRPLPPALVEFLVDYYGFGAIRLHRLNPVADQLALQEGSETAKRCNHYFYGPQDYAITAVKPGAEGSAQPTPP
ncbi:class I SAM-dependent methyltransferase [Thiorhodococcus minor]|uniref:Methyltransferase domain-containing protein n=1 Tax=Thiorhodococcus minor TaxID=57489 RepID=A0A6M0JW18_9GAMM|nr:class I SAM-dependent methyltransferase [Thiorhodococcus minor]NEV61111.1 methyltransferase domain-containing protein [Thiorhodococcus minor]